MTYQPVLPASGLTGWQFLQRTLASQKTAFDSSSSLKRDTDYFAEKIAGVTSIDQLMSDRRLLTVALGAFDLGDQINSKAMIRQVLEQGTEAEDALANRLSDKRWLALAQAFNFASGETPTAAEGFAQRIVSAFRSQRFDTAVSERDADLGLALKMQTAIPGLAGSELSEKAKWYTVLGTPSMRSLMQTALGLSANIVSVDIDQQINIFQTRAAQVFGGDDSLSQFSEPAKSEKLIQLFLVRSQINYGVGGSSGGTAATTSTALQLLQSSGATGYGQSGSTAGNGILSLLV